MLARWSAVVAGVRPEGTAVLVTRESMTSGALSAWGTSLPGDDGPERESNDSSGRSPAETSQMTGAAAGRPRGR